MASAAEAADLARFVASRWRVLWELRDEGLLPSQWANEIEAHAPAIARFVERLDGLAANPKDEVALDLDVSPSMIAFVTWYSVRPPTLDTLLRDRLPAPDDVTTLEHRLESLLEQAVRRLLGPDLSDL